MPHHPEPITLQLTLQEALVIRHCEHPSPIFVTTLSEMPHVLRCFGCGSEWTTPRDGMAWERRTIRVGWAR